jgi:bifunctional DNase/RNase
MIDSMLEAEIWSVAEAGEESVVLLKPLSSDMVAPIFIEPNEAHAILRGLEGKKEKRPLTCDMLLELSRHLGLSLLRVEIYEVLDNIFYARLFFSGGKYSDSQPLMLECLPTDAIALAVRERCSIRIAARVMLKAGLPVAFFFNHGAGVPQEMPDGDDVPVLDPTRLLEELQKALDQEDYERAADLRDTLSLLERPPEDDWEEEDDD